MKRHLLTLTLLISIVAVSMFSATIPAQAAGSGFVRVVHASPDAPAVDIYLDGTPAIKALAFGAATDFIPLPAKSYKVDIRPAGADAASKPVYTTNVVLPNGASATVVALGLLG